jgi:phage tail-like protein
MATRRTGPYAKFSVLVDLSGGTSGASQGGFQEVSGIGAQPTSGTTTLSLRRGVVDSAALSTWLDQIRRGDPAATRRVVIRLVGEDGTTRQTWTVVNARIIKHTSGPLNAKATDVAMEELVLGYDGLETI